MKHNAINLHESNAMPAAQPAAMLQAICVTIPGRGGTFFGNFYSSRVTVAALGALLLFHPGLVTPSPWGVTSPG